MKNRSTTPLRNRIVRHLRMRAGDLLPHELNPRLHPQAQKAALEALYREVGFARSLLAYEVEVAGQKRLKLIDGHLRRSLDPDLEVDVEVLDVNEEEARTLLLSLDPLARLAEHDQQVLANLRSLTHTSSDELENRWRSLETADRAVQDTLAKARAKRPPAQTVPEQHLILLECTSEAEQVRLLERFQREGLRCRALLS
jgi:hypothetical protein